MRVEVLKEVAKCDRGRVESTCCKLACERTRKVKVRGAVSGSSSRLCHLPTFAPLFLIQTMVVQPKDLALAVVDVATCSCILWNFVHRPRRGHVEREDRCRLRVSMHVTRSKT